MAATFKLSENDNTRDFDQNLILKNLQKTKNYGCFCRNLFSKNFTATEELSTMTQGRPVNHIDEICRDLIHQWSCLLQSTFLSPKHSDFEDLSLSANYILPDKFLSKTIESTECFSI